MTGLVKVIQTCWLLVGEQKRSRTDVKSSPIKLVQIVGINQIQNHLMVKFHSFVAQTLANVSCGAAHNACGGCGFSQSVRSPPSEDTSVDLVKLVHQRTGQ